MERKRETQTKVSRDIEAIRCYVGWALAIMAAYTIMSILRFLGAIWMDISKHMI